jgi:hypothetical protein
MPLYDHIEHARRVAAVEAALSEGHSPPGIAPQPGRRTCMIIAAQRLGMSAATLREYFSSRDRADRPKPDYTLYDRWRAAQGERTPDEPLDARREIAARERTIEDLRRRLRERDAADESERLASSLRFDPHRIDVPEVGEPDGPGFPMTLWSDWHWGETVDARETGGLNRFDREVALGRVERLVTKTVEILRDYSGRNPVFPGIWVCLGGDMISGGIHEELRETNWGTVEEQAHEVGCALLGALLTMADNFGTVYVPCVVGNHGRRAQKPPAKRRVRENREWGVYKSLEAQLAGDPRFKFFVPDDPDYLFEVYGHRYLLTHGDALGVKGGDGFIGAVGPIRRGSLRIGTAEAQVGRHFDTLVIGHWHQYQPRGALVPVIVNGAFKGYDEFARIMLRAPFDRPKQALWLATPNHGVGAQWAVDLD